MPSTLRVLVVEDSELMCETIRAMFGASCANRAYTLEFVATVSRARTVMENKRFDLVLIDLTLEVPGDGWGVAQRTRRTTDPLAVVVSGTVDEHDALMAQSFGAAFVSKPIDEQQLATICEAAWERKQLRQRRSDDFG